MTRQRSRGFLLLPVLLLLSMVAGAAYLTLREGHLSVAGELRQGDADKARAARVDVTLQVYPFMPHVFQGFAPLLPEAVAALQRMGEFTAS